MVVETPDKQQHLLNQLLATRALSLTLCETLETEDFVVQPVVEVSPPKWHLAHTTWFFETFILVPHKKDYHLHHKDYPKLFNSYYVAAGERWVRAERGGLTRPTVKEIMVYRQHVDDQLKEYLSVGTLSERELYLLNVGINHEQQHQELFLYDIKYILGHNPLFPAFNEVSGTNENASPRASGGWLPIDKGIYRVGYEGTDFHYDNETGSHQIFLDAFEIGENLVTNGEYIEFMEDGGYTSPEYWLSEGWDWVNERKPVAPMYWIREDDLWYCYTLQGLVPVNPKLPVSHVSFYEADAFARWKGLRLPTEFEWEVATRTYEPSIPVASNFVDEKRFQEEVDKSYGFYGNLWEWTSSSYRPYPNFHPEPGALGEYNGKFMINQMVLRGGSYGTSRSHIRPTYRNFFHPHLQWMFSGIRLAKSG